MFELFDMTDAIVT